MTLAEIRQLMVDAGPERVAAWRRLYLAASDAIPIELPLCWLLIDLAAAVLVDELRGKKRPIH